ncbi:MAG: hypothetical protein NC434_03720 [Ruminococcus sp.]|nr:hypothetical protein [Ruminococcus sp.]
MSEWIGNIECHQCIYLGEYDDKTDDKKQYMLTMLMRCRENSISLKRNNVTYKTTIVLKANRKKIEIEAAPISSVDMMLDIVHEILRFENLFEGMFFPLVSFTVDGENYTDKVQRKQLKYYQSRKQYAYIPINMGDREYRKLFRAWLKEEKKNRIIHPVFLYSVYLEGMPVDIRMALLLETFEPIAEDLYNKGIITLVKPPTRTYTNSCKNCGSSVSRTVPNKELEFKDKLKPILKKYGKNIFKGDAKTKLIAKAVKVRNKVDHVNVNTENVLNGEQCGFYIYKFSLMYRYIMLQEIGVEDKDINPYITEWVESFNRKYLQLRV